MRSQLPVLITLGFLAGNPAIAADRAPPSTAGPAPSPTDNEAAARHARLTACLKEAKAKKLVGEQKAAFIKECIAAH